MNWIVVFDRGKKDKYVESFNMSGGNCVEEVIEKFRTLFGNDYRIVSIVPMGKQHYEEYYNFEDDSVRKVVEDNIDSMRDRIALNVGSYEED